MKIIIILLTLLSIGCASKIVGKNCSQTHDEKFWVCDPVWVIK